MNKKLLVSLTVLLGVVSLAGVACSEAYPLKKWRYKMTVVIDTPEGVKTGSAVREVTFKTSTSRLPESGPTVTFTGEAVVVDLGKRGVLFALLKGANGSQDYGSDVSFRVFPYLITSKEPLDQLPNPGPKILSSAEYPIMVKFNDLNDPKTVKAVYQRDVSPPPYNVDENKEIAKLSQNLEMMFGSGVSLKEISIEIVDEPLIKMIDRWLPWLAALKGGYLHAGNTSRGAPLGLYGGNFKR